jgi:hypothetical protein
MVLTDPGGQWDVGYLMFESNDYKITHFRAYAQTQATALNCAILLQYYVLRGFQRTGPTMMAAYIPADPAVIIPLDPA